jgi:hypothetical protein
LRGRRPRLAGGFTLRCLQRLSGPYVGYPALPRAGQLEHQRYVLPNPLVLGKKPRKPPAPTTDRDRPVSRRSKPSSRTAFIGEQPNPWELLHPQDAMSRHRTDSNAFARRRLCLHPVVDFSSQLSALAVSQKHDLTVGDRSRRIAWTCGPSLSFRISRYGVNPDLAKQNPGDFPRRCRVKQLPGQEL